MNRKQLVDTVAKKTTMPASQVDKVLRAFIDTVGGTVKKGQDVSIVGFGSFKLRKNRARKGINPKTGERIQIAASRGVRFAAGQTLKDTVNGR